MTMGWSRPSHEKRRGRRLASARLLPRRQAEGKKEKPRRAAAGEGARARARRRRSDGVTGNLGGSRRRARLRGGGGASPRTEGYERGRGGEGEGRTRGGIPGPCRKSAGTKVASGTRRTSCRAGRRARAPRPAGGQPHRLERHRVGQLRPPPGRERDVRGLCLAVPDARRHRELRQLQRGREQRHRLPGARERRRQAPPRRRAASSRRSRPSPRPRTGTAATGSIPWS